jgi:putative flippase GtrA
MLAMVIARPLARINAFIFKKYVTFKSDFKGLGIIGEYFRFFMTYMGTFILALILSPVLDEVIGFHPRIGTVVIIIITAIGSYFGHSRFTFNKN